MQNISPMNLLVIAYYFPPLGLSGVQRTLKFVKYLTEFGWRPIVLTVGDTAYYAKDDSLLDEIGEQVERGDILIYRTDRGGLAERLGRSKGTIELGRAW